MIVQVQSLVLPFPYLSTTSVESVADTNLHISTDIWPLETLKEKTAIIWATEVVTIPGTAPGTLNCWVELSPFASSVSTAFWAAIGGGGGARAPVAPTPEVGIGTNNLPHTIILRWLNHSPYARVVVQTPISAVAAGSIWAVQVWFMAGG